VTLPKPRILILFPTGGREARMAEIAKGKSPRDFFYGALHLLDQGADIAFGNTRKDPNAVFGRLRLLGERYRNRVSNFGLSRQRIAALRDEIANADIAVSFTDAFSVSLGRYRDDLDCAGRLVGGFHGLTDIVGEVRPAFRDFAHRQIRQGVAGLDHLFFFGEADRLEAIRRYGIPAEKTSLFLFGVDTGFWSPAEDVESEGCVLAVGSDPKRDYATLLAAPIQAPIRIVTRLPVQAPVGRNDIAILRGNFYSSPVNDQVLRGLYREASVVAVPVRDVFQPSGYSVTLQAMACGKPVVLARIKGLWDPEVFVSGENCLLVEPEQPAALGEAIRTLHEDPALRRRIGMAARKTAVEHFGLERMNRSLEALIESAAGAAARPGWG
jgi:glycosyltransferase involved in cell wall biosynthesis